jgi:hypothetical protein
VLLKGLALHYEDPLSHSKSPGMTGYVQAGKSRQAKTFRLHGHCAAFVADIIGQMKRLGNRAQMVSIRRQLLEQVATQLREMPGLVIEV